MTKNSNLSLPRPLAGFVMLGGLFFAALASLVISASVLTRGGLPAADTYLFSILIPIASLTLSAIALLSAWSRSPKVASRLILPIPILCFLQLFFLLSGSYQYFDVTFGIGHLGAIFALSGVCGSLGALAAAEFHAWQMNLNMADVILQGSGDPPANHLSVASGTDADKLGSYWATRNRRTVRVRHRRRASSVIRLFGYPR